MTTPLCTADKDANYLSFNKASVVWYAGTPDEREHEGPLPPTLTLLPPDPKRWDSILKMSGREWTNLSVRVAQGKENAIDVNNESAYCTVRGDIGVEGSEGEQVITVKGGSHDIVIAGTVHSRGTDCTVEVGAWSDQSTAPCYNLDFRHLANATGRPLTFVFGRVKNPILAALGRADHIRLPDGAKVLFWASIAEQAYWWAKRIGVGLGVVR